MAKTSRNAGKTTYVALLRGINLGGHKLVKMEQLRKAFEDLRFDDVKTYIQSGNVIFKAPKQTPESLAKKIEEKILRQFGFPVPVVVKTADEIAEIVKNNSLVKEKGIDISKLHVTFLSSVPEKDAVKVLDAIPVGADQFCCSGKAVYLHCPDGYHATKLGNNVLAKILKTGATTRNWKTVNQLYQMSLD